jgi:Na+-transporting NADH:ubiquinone oxidoreductase subunit NqrF
MTALEEPNVAVKAAEGEEAILAVAARGAEVDTLLVGAAPHRTACVGRAACRRCEVELRRVACGRRPA